MAKSQQTGQKKSVEELRSLMLEAVEKGPPEPPLKTVVMSLLPEIRKMQDAGFSLQQIVNVLVQGGYDIKVGSLRTYLGGGKRKLPEDNPAATPAAAAKAAGVAPPAEPARVPKGTVRTEI